MSGDDLWENRIQNTLSQIGKAMRRQTGTRLTREQVADLKMSFFGETCLEADPRTNKGSAQ